MALDPAELLPEEEEPYLPFFGLPTPAEGVGLGPLLQGLSAALGPDGLTADLRRKLRQAKATLALHRRTWLQWDGLWRALQELLCDPRGILPPTRREVELRCGVQGTAQALPPMEPPPAPLLPLLELRLAAKVRDLSIYHAGESAPELPLAETVSTLAEARDPPPAVLRLGAALREEVQRLQRARCRRQYLQGALQSQRRRYQEVLGRCWALLAALAGDGCAGALQELDQQHGFYLESKGVALLLKTRLEELGLLLASYPPLTVAAHQCIKHSISLAVEDAEKRGQELRAVLSAYQGLGAELEELASAYGRLQEAVEQKRWALQQLHPLSP
ncbi:HAUS augmin-like complex subunit 4 isoform X1 [Melopsittacus undulatus]|uniref:HAUS augmin-like complex subunit 4 isoform X1 n=1 Tax=Melopsittacus undulatus TaxID=13146 RepID=UPI0012436020|nr:HAUS augmin-like complex subunit 4 isoform X1 [Melopsittacus undulatus]